MKKNLRNNPAGSLRALGSRVLGWPTTYGVEFALLALLGVYFLYQYAWRP